MKKTILSIIIMTCLTTITSYGQQISSHLYNQKVLHEDFNKNSDAFPIITTSDNYFIIDKGDYLLSRNNELTEYAILAKNESILNDFILKTSVRIGPSKNKRASVGVILKAQKNGKGAIIVEINSKSEYRIKQLVDASYTLLSGKNKNNGWQKNKNINGIDEHNSIEIRTEDNIYDLYINSEYINTFFVPDYTDGVCGIIISPETKARIAYYYIDAKGGNTTENINILNSNSETNIDELKIIEDLNKKIKNLEENNAKLIENNASMQKNEQIAVKEVKESSDKEIKELQSNIEELKSKINTKESDISILEKQISSNNKELNTQIENQNVKDKLIKDQENKISSLNSTKQQQKSDIENLKNKLTDSNEKILKKEKNIKKLQEEVKALKEKTERVTEELNTAKKDLNNGVNMYLEKERNLNKNILELKKSLSKNKNNIEQLEKEKDALTKRLITAEESYKKAQKSIEKNREDNTKRISRLDSKINTLENKETAHNSIVADLEDNINLLKDKISSLEKERKKESEKLKEQEKTNKELKQLFIEKDFEVSGISPSELKEKATVSYPEPINLIGTNEIYTVQIGVYQNKVTLSYFNGLKDVWYNESEFGAFMYMSGQFTSAKEATAHKNQLTRQGYSNAFVIKLSK